MSALDNAINSLTPDELDTLNSDPQMLASFKAKYAPQKSYGSQLVKNIVPDIKQNVTGLMNTVKTAAFDIPVGLTQSLAQKVGDVVTGQPSGPTPFEQTTSQLAENAPQMAKDIIAPIVHPITYTKEHPVSQAINLAMLSGALPRFGTEAGPESVTASFADNLMTDSNDALASINKKLANVPEAATKMEGYKQPIPTQAEINTATQNVINAYQQVSKEHGDMLNAAKEEAGLPASKEAIDTSVRRYGNQFGLNLNKPLDLPPEALQNAPEMEAAPVRPLQPGDQFTLKSSDPNMPDLNVVHKGPLMKAPSPEFAKKMGWSQDFLDKMNQSAFDLKTDMPAHAGDVAHPIDSTIGEETLNSHGYTVPKNVPLMKPEPSMNMQYSIGEHDTPEQLNTEINRFKANQNNIAASDKIKAASYLQDQIGQQGVFKGDVAKGPIMGRLKGQYGDLADIIKQASPSLQAAKDRFFSFKDSLNLVDDKIDPERPGMTQANLKRMFTSTSQATQDQLKQLAYFEQLTGKPVITSLFQKFAGQSFKDLVSRPGREMLEAAGGIGAAAMGHPAGLIGAAGLLTAQSPRALGAIEANAPSLAAKLGPAAALQAAKGLNTPFKTPEMQSLRDKLRNQQNVTQ